MRRSLALFAALVIGLDGYSAVMAGRERQASNRDSSGATTNGQPAFPNQGPGSDPFGAATTDNMPRAASDDSNRPRRAVGQRSQPTQQPTLQPMQLQPQEFAPLTPRGAASAPRQPVGAESKVLPWAADRGVTVDRPRPVQQQQQVAERGSGDRADAPRSVQLTQSSDGGGRPAPTDRGDRAGNGSYGPRIAPQQQPQQAPQQQQQPQQAPTAWQPAPRNPVTSGYEAPPIQQAPIQTNRSAAQPQQQVITQPQQAEAIAQPANQGNGGRRAVGESRYEPRAQPRYDVANQQQRSEPTNVTPQPTEWRNVGSTPSVASPSYRGPAAQSRSGESWQGRYAPAVAGQAYRPEPVARSSSSSRTNVSVGLGFNSYDSSSSVSVGVNYNSGSSRGGSGYRRGYYEPAYRGWGYDPSCYNPGRYYAPVVYRPVYYCPPVYPVYYGGAYIPSTTVVSVSYNSGYYESFNYCPAPVIYVPPPQPVVYIPPPPVYYVQPVAVAYSPVCYPVYRPGFSFSLSFFGRF